MERQKGTTTSRKGKHLNYNERIVIEKLLKAGLSKVQVAKEWSEATAPSAGRSPAEPLNTLTVI